MIHPMPRTRRQFLAYAAGAAIGFHAHPRLGLAGPMPDVELGERPQQDEGIRVLNPYGRVPVSFIVDDSTCLANMGHFCLPQFKEAWPERKGKIYDKAWKTWPREIPDTFVREFGEFCREHGVKGKYSIVPYPACVGWLDRELPGWSRGELRASLDLVRELMVPDWDIHPEMISHTRVIDIRSGRPLPQREDGSYWMENGGWCAGRSQDEIASYIAYALQLIKNLDLPCEGFTTPGGFGNPAKALLSKGGLEAVRSVLGSEIPHYFKYVVTDISDSTQPQVEAAAGIGGDTAQCIVNVPSCTGDYLGSWDGAAPNPTDETVERQISSDFTSGRLVEVINKGEPACFLTHWPGMYANGTGIAFRTFKETVRRLRRGFADRIRWMKLSEIARYWAAKELTAITVEAADGTLRLKAPFSAPGFTLEIPTHAAPPLMRHGQSEHQFLEVASMKELSPRTWTKGATAGHRMLCFDLPKGESSIH